MFTQIFWLSRASFLDFSIESVPILSHVQTNTSSEYNESFLKHHPGLGTLLEPLNLCCLLAL